MICASAFYGPKRDEPGCTDKNINVVLCVCCAQNKSLKCVEFGVESFSFGDYGRAIVLKCLLPEE